MSRKKPSKEILQQVTHEIEDHLAAIEAILLRLGDDPANGEDLSELFRYMHTIKGVAGVLEKPPLVEIAHRAENLLVGFRDGKKSLGDEDLDLLLQAKDLLGRVLRGEGVDAADFLSKLSGSAKLSPAVPAARSDESFEPAPAAATTTDETEDEESEPVFLVFRVRGSLCAFPVDRIREVSQVLPWRAVPFTRESFCGMTSLRGQLVPVLDPAALLGIPGPRPQNGRILFLETGEEFAGVLVDRVLGVHPLQGWQRSVPALRHFGVDLVDAVASFRDEGAVAVISPDRLLEIAGA